MEAKLIHDRGRGPEIVGTRITVYNLMPHLLDPSATEESICKRYELSAVQVAAVRAYVLNHADTVLSEYVKIEQRLAVGNPPEVIEQARQTRERFQSFKQWLADRDRSQNQPSVARPFSHGVVGSSGFPTFEEWLVTREVRQSPES